MARSHQALIFLSKVVQLMPVNSGFWKWGVQKEESMLQEVCCQRSLVISLGVSAGEGHQWLSAEGQTLKLAELALCRLCLEWWGKSVWILLLLSFPGGFSPQSCEMVLAVMVALWRQEVDKPSQLLYSLVQRENTTFRGEIAPGFGLQWLRRDQT